MHVMTVITTAIFSVILTLWGVSHLIKDGEAASYQRGVLAMEMAAHQCAATDDVECLSKAGFRLYSTPVLVKVPPIPTH